MHIPRILIGLLVSLIFLIACSVQKRSYRSGYYVSWRGQAIQLQHKFRVQEPERKAVKTTASLLPDAKAAFEVHRQLSVQQHPTEQYQSIAAQQPRQAWLTNKLVNAGRDTCDVIILRNGDELQAKVKEVGYDEIRYVKCGFEDGPVYVVRKSTVFMLKYANGTKEVFQQNQPRAEDNPTGSLTKRTEPPPPVKVEPLAVISLIAGLLSFLFFAIPLGLGAFLTGIAALRKIERQPNTRKGKVIARIGLILGIIALTLGVLAILILL